MVDVDCCNIYLIKLSVIERNLVSYLKRKTVYQVYYCSCHINIVSNMIRLVPCISRLI